MNIHAQILAELPEGSKPAITITSHPIGEMFGHHVNDSIELSAWWFVRQWCKKQDAGLVVSDIGSTPVDSLPRGSRKR